MTTCENILGAGKSWAHVCGAHARKALDENLCYNTGITLGMKSMAGRCHHQSSRLEEPAHRIENLPSRLSVRV